MGPKSHARSQETLTSHAEGEEEEKFSHGHSLTLT